MSAASKAKRWRAARARPPARWSTAELNEVESAGMVAVRVRSGDVLHVGFTRTGPFAFENVTLAGPADFVFSGEVSF